MVDIEPRRLPDLFAGQPLLVHARYTKPGRGSITLRGWAGAQRIEVSTRVHLPALEEDNNAQARLWARARGRGEGANVAALLGAEGTPPLSELVPAGALPLLFVFSCPALTSRLSLP